MTDTIYLTFNGKPVTVQAGQPLLQASRVLLTFTIDAKKCTGCTLCAQICPGNCICGAAKEPQTIQQEKCLHCGTCLEMCQLEAVTAQ